MESAAAGDIQLAVSLLGKDAAALRNAAWPIMKSSSFQP